MILQIKQITELIVIHAACVSLEPEQKINNNSQNLGARKIIIFVKKGVSQNLGCPKTSGKYGTLSEILKSFIHIILMKMIRNTQCIMMHDCYIYLLYGYCLIINKI